MILTRETGRYQLISALFLALAMALVVGTALGFEHIGGFIPCKLCLEQREPYYAGIVVALFALAAAVLKWPVYIVRGALLIIGLLMTYGLLLAVFHSGVEWAWWAGPSDCSTSSTSGIVNKADDLLGALGSMTPPSCDKAAGRFLGLSFAGWNVITSLFLAGAAYRAAFGSSDS
jgi:disulfide bond formation protein DsbB